MLLLAPALHLAFYLATAPRQLPLASAAPLLSSQQQWRRHGDCRCGACADICIERLGATTQEAEKAEAKLMPSTASSLSHSQGISMCNALQSRLGLSEAELKKVVLGSPPLLGLNVEANVLPSLAALQSRLGLSEAELKKVVLGLPSVLGYSMEANVLPKVAFFQRDLGLTDEEVRERVVSCPAMLGYSLEGRLRPRWELCQSMGLPPSMLFSYKSKTPEAFEEACTRARAREEEREK